MSSNNSCFIFNLPPGSSESLLYDSFSQFGRINKVQIWETRIGTANGVIYFNQSSSARKAIQEMDSKMVKGNMIQVKEYKHNVSLNCLGRLILRVPPRVSERQIIELCSNHGRIKHFEMLDNGKQQAKYMAINGLRIDGYSLEPRLCEKLVGDEDQLVIQAFDFCSLPAYLSNDPKLVTVVRDGWELTIENNFRIMKIEYHYVCVRFQFNGPIFAIIKFKYQNDVEKFIDRRLDILSQVFGTCQLVVINQLQQSFSQLPQKQRQAAMNKIYKFQELSDKHKLNVFKFTPHTVKISAYEYKYYNEKLMDQDAQYNKYNHHKVEYVWKEKKKPEDEEQDFNDEVDDSIESKGPQFDESEIIKIIPNPQIDNRANNLSALKLSIEELLDQEFDGQKENKKEKEQKREKLKGYKLRDMQAKTISNPQRIFTDDSKDRNTQVIKLQDDSLLDDCPKPQTSLIRRQQPNLLECEQIIEQLLDEYDLFEKMTKEQRKSKIRDVLKIRIKAAYIMHPDLLTKLATILEQELQQSISDLVMLHNDQDLLHMRIQRAICKIQQPIQRELIQQF